MGRSIFVDGTIETPTEKVRGTNHWIVDSGETVPRLVTAYPNEED